MKKGKIIKAIVFDVAGVLCKKNMHKIYPLLDKLAESYKVNSLQFRELRKKYAKSALTGKISAGEFKNIIVNRLRIVDKKDFIKKWDKIVEGELSIDKKAEKTVNKLKKNYILATLTNVTEMMDQPRIKHRLYKHFKVKLASYQLKTKKPQMKFYRLLIKRLGVNPKDIIFIDDDKENLLPAENLGMKTILFKNNKQLIYELKKLGVVL